MFFVIFFILFFLTNTLFALEEVHSMFVVKDPVASLWTIPSELSGTMQTNGGNCFFYPALCNPFRDDVISMEPHDSQMVYGEQVNVLEKNGEMLRVAIPGQKHFDSEKQKWVGITGYTNAQHILEIPAIGRQVTMVAQKLCTAVRTMPNNDADFLQEIPFGGILHHAAFEEINGYTKVSLLDGTVGFVRSNEILRITSTPEEAAILRTKLCMNVLKFLGMPYCWGGRSVFIGATAAWGFFSPYPVPTSVDCSGLISLVMHSLGLSIPRNSSGQYTFSTPVNPIDMQAGDIIYLAPNKPGITRHILMYLGNNIIIDSTGSLGTTSGVRLSSVEELFGRPLKDLNNGYAINNDQTMQCGSFFIDTEKIAAMRADFLACVGG